MADQQLGLDLDEAPRQERTGARASFHVRSHVTATEASAGEARARGQEESILAWVRAQGQGRRFTPSQVHAAFPRLELTSVRARMTTLTVKGLLVHHQSDRHMGPRGASESTWSAA